MRPKDTDRLRVKVWKKKLHAKTVTKRKPGYLYQTKFIFINSNQKEIWLPLLISDKIDFTYKTVARDKERHFIVKDQCTAAAAAAKSLQSCPTLCNPIDGSPPGPAIPGILQAGTLEWVAISFSNA